MSSRLTEQERKVSGALLIVFAAFILAALLLEIGLASNVDFSWENDFLIKSNAGYVVSFYMAYLVMSCIGFVGFIGLIHTYGAGASKLVVEITKLATLAFFLTRYWMWSAMWIVQHKMTYNTRTPTNPEPWLIQTFRATDSFWSLPSWGGFPALIVSFLGIAWLLYRGARRLPRVAAVLFVLLAASKMLVMLFMGLRGVQWNSANTVAKANDWAYFTGFIVALALSGAAVYTEKGFFARRR